MTRPGKRPSPANTAWPDRLDQLALLLVLGVICARATMQERPDYEELSLVNRLQGGSGQIGGPGPATSLVLDGLILVSATCCAVGAAIRGRWAHRAPGVAIALILMVASAATSLAWASNVRLAIVASVDRIAAVLALVVMAQTVRRWWQVRLVLVAVAATGVAYAAFCIAQVYERADTRQWIQQQKDEAVRSGRIAVDDPRIQLLERRAASGEVSGFFAHSNIGGGYLMACALATLALGIARLRAGRRTHRLLFGLVTLLAGGVMAVGMVLTLSRGALLTGIVCGLAWAMGGLVWRRWAALRQGMIRRWVVLLAAGWAGVVLLIAVTAAVGLHRGRLYGGSLTFRWHYWSGAACIVAEHPWVGIGAGNFDRHYVRHKAVEAPEEVRNPHNYLMTTVTEWGVVGLAGAMLLLVAISFNLARPIPEPRAGPDRSNAKRDGPGGGRIFLWLAPLLAGVLIARSVASPGQLWLIWALVPSVIWAIAYVVLALDSDQTSRFEDDPLPVSGGLAAALLAVGLHNMISFSMTYPGSACTFFALAGLAIATRRIPRDPPAIREGPAGHRQAWTSVLATGAVVGSVVYWPVLVAPVSQATSWLARARGSVITADALASYRHAVQADPLDPVAPAELARWSIRRSQQDPAAAVKALDLAIANILTAIQRDPQDNRNSRTLSSAYVARYVARADPNDVDRAVEAASRAVTLYPKLPILRYEYGEVLALQATVRGRPDWRARAVDQMRLALQLDDKRFPNEVRRFPANRRAGIQERIRELQTPTAPASRPDTMPEPGGAAAPTR